MLHRAFVVLLILAGPAHAFWISKNPQYIAPKHAPTHCSGPQHCKPVPGRVVFVVRDGKPCWAVRGMTGCLPPAQIYRVPNRKQPWACMWSGNQKIMTGGSLVLDQIPEAPWPVSKEVIIDRLEAAGVLGAAITALKANPALRERWLAAPHIMSDNARFITFLSSVGADPAAVLAK